MAAIRKMLRSGALKIGGDAARNLVNEYLSDVPDVSVTGFVKSKYINIQNQEYPRFECEVNSAVRLISQLYALERKFDPWSRLVQTVKGSAPKRFQEVLIFTSEDDAVLARLMVG